MKVRLAPSSNADKLNGLYPTKLRVISGFLVKGWPFKSTYFVGHARQKTKNLEFNIL